VQIKDLLIKKFGKDFGEQAIDNKNGVVNSRIVHKLSLTSPDPLLVTSYLEVIAKAYDVAWRPRATELDDIINDVKSV
jgi:vacuolar protein sorting-associated protein IST1